MDRDDALTERRVDLALVAQDLHVERGGGQREREADDESGLPGEYGREEQRPRDREPAEQHLRAAQPENVVAKIPQPLGAQFQADHEQQQHHAELGEAECRFGIGDEAEQMRPDDHARHEIAEHRAELQPVKQRHHRDRRRKIHHTIAKQGGITADGHQRAARFAVRGEGR